jgi:acetylglutamate/LysW-gamma-L-alpha-aminoadipate kinase
MNVLVVKIGGGEGLDLGRCADDLSALAGSRALIVVHGVSAMANSLAEARGMPVQMLTSPSGHSSRYTYPAMRDIYVEAAQRVNGEVVRALRVRGVSAVGVRGDVVQGERKRAIRAVINGRVRVVRDDYSGSITKVNAAPLRELLDVGLMPVVPPMAWGGDEDGYLNVDGDRAAAAIAAAVGADDLVILSNVRGLYRNFSDEASFVEMVSAAQFSQAMDWAQGRMKRKVLSAQEALSGGVRRVIISDGRARNPVHNALQGAGTVFAV